MLDLSSTNKRKQTIFLSIGFKPYENKSKLVSAFHVISEKLVNPTLELDYDIFVCGDDDESVQIVNGLINEIKGLRPIYLGGRIIIYGRNIYAISLECHDTKQNKKSRYQDYLI